MFTNTICFETNHHAVHESSHQSRLQVRVYKSYLVAVEFPGIVRFSVNKSSALAVFPAISGRLAVAVLADEEKLPPELAELFHPDLPDGTVDDAVFEEAFGDGRVRRDLGQHDEYCTTIFA